MLKEQMEHRRETYRQALAGRVRDRRGATSDAARAARVDPSTATLWFRRPGAALPTAFEVLLIAEAKRVAPGWLAYGEGPRDPAAWPILTELAAAVEPLGPVDRERLLDLARALSRTPSARPAPPAAPGAAPRGFAPPPIPATEVRALAREVARLRMTELPVESPESRVLADVARLLDRLSAPAVRPPTPAPPSPGVDRPTPAGGPGRGTPDRVKP